MKVACHVLVKWISHIVQLSQPQKNQIMARTFPCVKEQLSSLYINHYHSTVSDYVSFIGNHKSLTNQSKAQK